MNGSVPKPRVTAAAQTGTNVGALLPAQQPSPFIDEGYDELATRSLLAGLRPAQEEGRQV